MLVLEHYPELSSAWEPIEAWSEANQHLIPAEMERTRNNLTMLHRKVMVADLTGAEDQERKAKFIYDLSPEVSYIWLASLILCALIV